MNKDKIKPTENKEAASKTANTVKGRISRKFDGVVVSDKMDKTIVVRVDSTKIFPGIKKRITRSKRYKVHDEKNSFKEGDRVSFIECRSISKDKKWKVMN
jgi:small subunit ribosomal protein S17